MSFIKQKLSTQATADALVVSSESVLRRRRERAAYALAELRLANRTRKAVILFALGCVVVALLAQIRFARKSPPQERPLQLSDPSPVGQFDRFNVDYLVRDDDTLWTITSRFYGKPSRGNIRKVRAANPWLSPNDSELRIGVKLKIPIH
jgi:phage tail protein X